MPNSTQLNLPPLLRISRSYLYKDPLCCDCVLPKGNPTQIANGLIEDYWVTISRPVY